MCRLNPLLFLLVASLPNAKPYGPVLESLKLRSITFIGESHKRIESIGQFRSLVTDAVDHGRCITLALEIAESEQPTIDCVLNQGDSVSNIAIPDSIDHLALRHLIRYMALLKTRSTCLNVAAIDADPDSYGARR